MRLPAWLTGRLPLSVEDRERLQREREQERERQEAEAHQAAAVRAREERERAEAEEAARQYEYSVEATARRARAFSAGAPWGSEAAAPSRLSGRRSWGEKVIEAIRVGWDAARRGY